MITGTVAILDMKGLAMHSYYRAEDSEPLTDREGKKIRTARAGVSTFIRSYLEEILTFAAPYNIIAVWDGGNEFRRRMFPAYKDNRRKTEKHPMEEEQLERMYKALKAIFAYSGAINVQAPTVEGDDLIALLSEGLPNNQFIYTVDNDLLQLYRDTDSKKVLIKVTDNLKEYYTLKTENFQMEVAPHHLVMLKALVGDSSDGYGGVPGVGPVAFKYLVEEYGWDGIEEIRQCILNKDWEPIREAAASNNCKVLRKILENTDKLSLCYNLAILHPESCYGFTGQTQIKPQFYKRVPNAEKLKAALSMVQCGWMFEEYFSRFMPTYTLVTETNFPGACVLMREQAMEGPCIAYDHETYDSLQHADFLEALPKQRRNEGYLDVLSARLSGTSFAFGPNMERVFYFSFNHRETLNIDKALAKPLYDWMYGSGRPVLAHNAGFEVQVLHNEYDVWYTPTYDTVTMSSAFDENNEKGLKDLSLTLLGYTQTTYKELLAQYNAKDMRDLSGLEVLDYGCDDSLVTAHLSQMFYVGMCMEKTWSFYQQNDLRPTDAYAKAFETGVNINWEKLELLRERDEKLVAENFKFIQDTLKERCSEIKPQHANAFFAAEREFFMAEMQDAAVSKGATAPTRSHMLSRLEEKRLKLQEKTIYVPYTETVIPFEFKPTQAQFEEVMQHLNFSTFPASVSGKALTFWLAQVQDEAQSLEQVKFLELLVACINAKQLKDREGEHYEALAAFCQANRARTGKTVEEGDELNFGSPKQMQELFYLKLGLPVRCRNDVDKGSLRSRYGLEGSPSTNEEAVMKALSEDCPDGDWRRDVLKKVLEIKSANTRRQLYWNPYPHWVHPRDGMIHPGIKNSSTVTRRPAGTSPNLLQVEGGETRTIFLPRYKGKQIIVCIDFNGQELRLTGSEAKDPVLIECYTGLGSYTDEYGMLRQKIRDVHSVTGCGFAQKILSRSVNSEVMKLLEFDSQGIMKYDQFYKLVKHEQIELDCSEDILKELQSAVGTVRGYAKVVNFLLIYGGNEHTLGEKLGLPVPFCLELLESVFKKYPRLRPWQEETAALAERLGYVTTAYGNRRHLNEDVRSNDRGVKSRMLRQAGNATIQGCAADILKVVMTGMENTNLLVETKSCMHAPVYDEIFSSVHIDYVFEYCQRLQDLMNVTPPGHPIPMMGEVGIGLNWGQCKQIELKDRPSQKKIELAIEKMLKEAGAV